MRIWLDQVREEPFTWDETQSVSPETLERPELLALSPVSWRGQVIFADPGFFLRARLSYEQTLSCIRCLKPIVERVEPEVELMILVERHAPSGGRARADEQDDWESCTCRGEVLDTEPILHRAAPAQRADEAALPAGLPGALPGLRRRQQRRRVLLRGADGGPALGGARRSQEPARRREMDNPKTREA